MKSNKHLYVSYLLNAPKDIIDRMTDEDINDILKNSIVQKFKSMQYFCSDVTFLLSFSCSAFHENAVNALKDQEGELKKENIYDSSLEELYKQDALFTMFEFLGFYELTFIKRFFCLQLLSKISNESFKTFKDYNLIRKEFNLLIINYDQQLLFKAHGSPRILYSKLLLKSGTDLIFEKVDKMLSNVREDVNSCKPARYMTLINLLICELG